MGFNLSLFVCGIKPPFLFICGSSTHLFGTQRSQAPITYQITYPGSSSVDNSYPSSYDANFLLPVNYPSSYVYVSDSSEHMQV